MMHYESINSSAFEQEDDLISSISDEVQRDSGNSSHCSSAISSCTDSSSGSIVYDKDKYNKKKFQQKYSDENELYEDDDEQDQFGSRSVYFKLNKAPVDVKLVEDERTLKHLLHLEDYYRVQSNYFVYVQSEIKPWMRKTLASWMLEVCKNQSREDDVFVLAMNILDRFLCLQPIAKRHLQLLGTVCMFIAAKLRSAVQFNAETLVIYTANSITIEEILVSFIFTLFQLKFEFQFKLI
jgi:hypothetical protein